MLISLDSVSLVAGYAKSEQFRRQISRLCATTFRADFPTKNSDHPVFGDIRVFDSEHVNTKFGHFGPNATTHLRIYDENSNYVCYLNELIPCFPDLKVLVIAANINSYSDQVIRRQFPQLEVKLIEFVPDFDDHDILDTHTICLSGTFCRGDPLDGIDLPEWLCDIMKISISDGDKLKYTSPFAAITVVPDGPRTKPGWSKFLPEYVETLTIDTIYNGVKFRRAPHWMPSHTLADCLREFTAEKYKFPRLRQLFVGIDGHVESFTRFLERMRPTMFPVLDEVSISSVPLNATLSSSFLKIIKVMQCGENVCISCPACEILKVPSVRGIALSRATRPKVLRFHECRGVFSTTFEQLAQSANRIKIGTWFSFVKSDPDDPPMNLPQLKILIVAALDSTAHSTPIRFFAPNLEEIWIGGRRIPPDEIPREENGAFSLSGPAAH
jgi:hypothetical protein